MHIVIDFDVYLIEISILLDNLCLSYQWIELKYIRDDWQILVKNLTKDLTEDNTKKAMSVIGRIKYALAEVNECLVDLI
jgi:hypothetical protein